MGSFYRNGRVRSYIMILLAIAALLIAAPVKKVITRGVNDRINSFTTMLHDTTGLSITYERLSPSILSNFYIHNIRIYDDSGNSLLSISKTRVTYSLLNLIKKDLQKGISSVIVDGITLDVDELVLIMSRFNGSESGKVNIAAVKKIIPENIKLKNIYLEYNDNKISSLVNIKNIGVSNSLRKNTIDVQADALINASLTAFKKHISGKVSAAGSITDNFDGSQLNLKLRDFTDGDYRLNKLNLHASYTNGTVEAHTIQAVNPVSLGVFYDFKSGDINGQVRLENLKPLSLLTINSKQIELKKFRELSVNTNTIIKSNIYDRTLNFITDTSLVLPDEVFSGGADISFSIFGDEKKAELTRFSVDGENCTASAKLSLIYESKQLEGYIELPQYKLPNGNIISTELYFDPLDQGFMAFSPQIFIGSRSLAAFQLTVLPQSDSYDFSFELADYSHLEEIEPGRVRVDGSFLSESNYFQSNITLSSLYIDSLTGLAAQLLPADKAGKIESLMPSLEPYLLSGDIYASTDLKTFSYNIPYVLLANTRSDNQALMFAINGTDSSIQLNQLSLIIGKFALEASASLDSAPDSSDKFFTADLNIDSIPYHFSGSIMPEVINITGDYGTDVEFRFTENNAFGGHLNLKSLPVKVLDKSIIFTAAMNFTYDTENGPDVQINHLELEQAGGVISVNPKLVLSGNATKYGARIDNIAYSDYYSVMEGTADTILNINENVFDSVGIAMNLRNPFTDEMIIVDGSISNPEHLPINKDTLLKSIYMNLQMQLKNFSLSRFVPQTNDNNMVTGMLFTSGTIEHPYIALNIDSLSLLLATDFLKGKGNIILEDRDLTISDLNINYKHMDFSNIQASASLTDWTLDATGEFYFELLDKNLTAPLVLTAGNALVPEGKLFPDSVMVTLSTAALGGSLVKQAFPLSLSALYANNVFSIFSSDNGGLTGTYTKEGLLELNLDNKDFLSAKLDGLVNLNGMNLELYDVLIDLPKACNYLNIDELFIAENGLMSGDVVVTGSMNDPELNGWARIVEPVVKLPTLFKQRISAPELDFSIVSNEIQIPETLLTIKNNQRLLAGLTIYLNKWSFDHMEGDFSSYKTDLLPLDLKTDVFSLEGNVSADINLYFEENVMDVSGSISGENIDLAIRLFALSNLSSGAQENTKAVQFITDLDVTLGNHATVQLDPVLRCVFVPNSTMKVMVNQPEDQYIIDGELKFKSGDVAYLNRNFYIKSGNIKFNEDIANPIITVNAETRERDDRGQNVKIVMSVEDQELLNLQPRFSSIPAKSENEIRALLGQIVVADSNSAGDFFFAASDYALQSMVVRQAENKLRDLLNFDIFSLRTNVLQNTYNYSISRNSAKENISLGNFLDNTTVYIGKYLGSSLYVDAMLHVSFEDSNVNDITSAGKMLFQPEFGMELESPFANIRVNMAPDINALLKNQFVPSASVTLSWKFAY